MPARGKLLYCYLYLCFLQLEGPWAKYSIHILYPKPLKALAAAWRALSEVLYPYIPSLGTSRLKSLEPSFVSIYPEPKDKPWLQLRALSQVVQYVLISQATGQAPLQLEGPWARYSIFIPPAGRVKSQLFCIYSTESLTLSSNVIHWGYCEQCYC